MKIAVIIDPQKITQIEQPEFIGVKKALEAFDNQVAFIGADKNLIQMLTADKYEFIVNMAGKIETNYKPAQYAGILDIVEIPYTGSGVDSISLCKNKALFKPIIQVNWIPTPNYEVLKIFSKKIPSIQSDIKYPVVIKIYTVGILHKQQEDYVAMDEKDLIAKLNTIIKSLKYSYCMIEEFIFGRKLYVPIIGNDLTNDLMTLPPMEVPIPQSTPQEILKNMSPNPELKPIDPSSLISKRAQNLAESAFLISNCRDVAMATLIIDQATGNLLLHEINPLPDLLPGGTVSQIAQNAGISYEDLINRILYTAMKRYELKISPKYNKFEKK
jgi:D-alanine-D-alanine ligase